MQNMCVEILIENIRTKIVIKFHFMKFMIYLAWVVNSMVIFSASYLQTQPALNHLALHINIILLDRHQTTIFQSLYVNKPNVAKNIDKSVGIYVW